MDILEETLDSGQELKAEDSPGEEGTLQLTDASGTAILDPTLQYQLRAETTPGLDGQVTYRVVHVTPNGEEAQVVTSQAAAQLAQAVQFSNGGSSPSQDSELTAYEYIHSGETRYAYFSGAGDASVQVQTAGSGGEVSAVPIGQVTTAGGQFYVMMSPQDVLQSQGRTLAPRATSYSPKLDGVRQPRDDRKRATHNEVERRRRDKINSWIVQLSKLVPDCSQDQLKGGQVGSKGGILAKACEYIQELKSSNMRLAESIKSSESIVMDAELLRQQNEELKQENAVLRAQLQQHGLMTADLVNSA